jgi:hypothetical protein
MIDCRNVRSTNCLAFFGKSRKAFETGERSRTRWLTVDEISKIEQLFADSFGEDGAA